MKRSIVVGVLGLAGVFAGVGACSLKDSPLVVKWFGPPEKQLVEVFADDPQRATFDHSRLDAVLGKVVFGGRVDYDALVADPADLFAYTDALADAPFEELDRNGKLALLMNAYNAFTLRLIVERWPVASIKDIPADERWDDARWELAGRTLSLTQIEHDWLRAKFADPRIHFGINCASVGCPPLATEAFVGERVDEQLETLTRQLHADARWVFVQRNSALNHDTVQLTKLYLWYGSDFEQVAGSPLGFVGRYVPEVQQGAWDITWLDYDWSINDVP